MTIQVVGEKCSTDKHANELFAWRFSQSVGYVVTKTTPTGNKYHNAHFTVFIARNAGYYFFKIISIQALVCAWNYSVFWLPAGDFG